MTATIATYEPIDTLKPVADRIWLVDGPLIDFSWAGLRLPFPTRMTVIRLAAGDLWLHSPTALTPGLKAEVDALGPMRHLIAPNKLHYWWVGDWQKAYPEALAYAAPGVRRRAARRGIAFERDLAAEPAAAWAGEIDQVLVPGSFMTEVAFFHRPSRSLILTDLIENFEPAKVPSGWLRLLMRLGGVMEPGGTPRDMRLTFLGHRKAVRQAVATMLDWRPQHV
ncbi:MAG: DUF4336 domain-containing protein, partial [Geminicoccales bacterium]